MRELVEQIDAHAEPDDTEATSIPSTQDQLSVDPLFSVADQQQTGATEKDQTLSMIYLPNHISAIFFSTAFLLFPTICLVNLPMSLGCGD